MINWQRIAHQNFASVHLRCQHHIVGDSLQVTVPDYWVTFCRHFGPVLVSVQDNLGWLTRPIDYYAGSIANYFQRRSLFPVMSSAIRRTYWYRHQEVWILDACSRTLISFGTERVTSKFSTSPYTKDDLTYMLNLVKEIESMRISVWISVLWNRTLGVTQMIKEKETTATILGLLVGWLYDCAGLILNMTN